ncbi:MAG: hypothetical protein H6550_16205 [Chitinophagales bacterium]|nr:hypothetical protein [Chitinophagales bacterium]
MTTEKLQKAFKIGYTDGYVLTRIYRSTTLTGNPSKMVVKLCNLDKGKFIVFDNLVLLNTDELDGGQDVVKKYKDKYLVRRKVAYQVGTFMEILHNLLHDLHDIGHIMVCDLYRFTPEPPDDVVGSMFAGMPVGEA